MNEQLKNLYSSRWDEISNMLDIFNEETEMQEPNDDSNKATYPLLIQTNEEYFNATTKIIFFGQETNGWGKDEINNGIFEEGTNIDSVINIYNSFYLQKGYEKYGKSFWNFIKVLKNNKVDKKNGFIWNNVLKIGKIGISTPQQGLINYTIDYFNVLPQEIEILKPNILLFLSGPKYDKYIEKSVGNFTIVPIDGFTTNELCILKFDIIKVDLALRTYHPRGMDYKGQEVKNRITNKIIEFIGSV